MSDIDITTFLRQFQAVSDAAAQLGLDGDSERPPLDQVLREHLGVDPRDVPTVNEMLAPIRQADSDAAVRALVDESGGGRLLGIGGGDQRWHMSLSDMVQSFHLRVPVGPVEYTSVQIGPGEERSIVAMGLWLFRAGDDPVAVLVRMQKPQYGARAGLEVLAPGEGVAQRVLVRIRALMNELSVLRGKVLSLVAEEFGDTLGDQPVTFHRRPEVGADRIVLPPGTLDRVERHVLGIGEHRALLTEHRQHLKRGVLLYGPPGTGKTLTVHHLIGAAAGTTVILLSGRTLAYVTLAAQTARALEPAIVVLEDCDLVAEERTMDGSSPLLFEVLDALDGLSPDADVVFLLTTNRVDVLEPALAQRPGRVDLAVEIPRPDLSARRALLDLYAGGLGFSDDALDDVAATSEHMTASFMKEVTRRAVLMAADEGVALSDDHLKHAVEEMMADASAMTRALLGSSDADDDWADAEF